GDGRTLRAPERGLLQSLDHDGGGGFPRLPDAGLPVPLTVVAAADLSDATAFAGRRALRTVDSARAVECFELHGRHLADRSGYEKWHPARRIHSGVARRGSSAGDGVVA